MQKIKKETIAYLHTHWDHEWYRSSAEFNVRLCEIFDKILDGLINNEIPCFYFDGQVLALLNYMEFHPEKNRIIKKLIKEKKLYIGPFFASVDTFLPSGISLYKNLELGIDIAKKLGQQEFIGYLSDSFGHSEDIFQILKLFNIEYAIIWRGAGNLPSDFMLNGIKTTRLVFGYYHEIEENLKKSLDKIAEYSSDVLLLPIGADHMMPPFNANSILSEIKQYDIKIKSPFEYLKKANFNCQNLSGELLDNSNSFLLPGVRSIRTREKAKNAELEWNLYHKTEILNHFMGRKYNRELYFAEKELLKNHAHDSIYGCSLDKVSEAVCFRQTVVEDMQKTIFKNLVRDFKNKFEVSNHTLNSNSIGVFNFSNYKQKGTAKIITDKKIEYGQKIRTFNSVSDEIMTNIYKNPMTEDFHDFYEYLVEIEQLEAFSFSNFKLKKPAKAQHIEKDFIENENLKLFVLNNSVYAINKKTGEIYENLIEIYSTKDEGDSYNYAPVEPPINLKLKSSKIKTDGIIQSTLELKFEENIILDISLSNRSEFFEIEAKFNNKKKNRNLQIVVNTQSEIKETLSYNPIGTIKRKHNPNYSLYEAIKKGNEKEFKTNSFPMNKFVAANKIAILTKGLYDYEIYKNQIKISLLRSIGIISKKNNPARTVPAGPPIECPKMQCIGVSFEFKLGIAFYTEEKECTEKLKPFMDKLFDPCEVILGEFKIKNKKLIKHVKNKEFMGVSTLSGKVLYI